MHILITGGAGFLGRRLAMTLLERGRLRTPDGADGPIDRLTLLDVVEGAPLSDPRVRTVTGDIADPDRLARIIDADTTSIFHLAAVVSGMAEAEFEKGMRVNLDATRALLERCRAVGHSPRVVFASSGAVHGGTLPARVPETMAVNPQTSYGTQKAIGELLVSDYSRRGFIDGRALRLATICVRPGRPNAAASSFASGIIREPLNGEDAKCPVGRGTRVWVASPATAIDGLISAHDLDSAALGDHRVLTLPGLSISVGEMVDALERDAGKDVVARIRWEPDERIARIVAGWAGDIESTRARSFGFRADASFDDIIRQHMQERAAAKPLR